MVKIRLARGGAKKRPFYHIVVTDKRNARDGRYIERLGFFNPVAIGGEVPLRVDVERVEYWKGRGAQLSERVLNLVKHLSKNGETAAPARAAPPVSKVKNVPAAKVEAEVAEAADAKDAATGTGSEDAKTEDSAEKE